MKSNQSIVEEVIEIFRKADKPLRIGEISNSLQIKSDTEEYQVLRYTIKDLTETEILKKSARRRYLLNEFEIPSTLEGTIRIVKGRGIVDTIEKELSGIIIKRKHLFTALDGDKVNVKLLGAKKANKYRGEVIGIVERTTPQMQGTIDSDGDISFFIPDDEKHYLDFLIPKKKLKKAEHGDRVLARFVSWDDPSKTPLAEVIKILGKAGKPEVEYGAIIKEFKLPENFKENILAETAKIRMPGVRVYKNRLDLRNETIITIDPEDAKDFDDALSLEILENGNFKLGVHIADVSYFVPENSELDIEARNRGTSVYLVDRVVPMLPEKLSNGICSLAPDSPRLTFSCIMEITKRGLIKSYEIKESVIKSDRRFNYDEVQKIIETGEGDFADLILQLDNLAKILRKKRFSKGGIDFQTVEIKFKLDENKYPKQALMRRQTDATSLVEECMLAANKTVAEYLTVLTKRYSLKNKLPYLYRVHDEPDPKQIRSALKYVSSFGHKLYGSDLSSKEINNILGNFSAGTEKYIIHQVLIRAMSKAIYSTNNTGHYGLGFDSYTHFTSPIRRYPDLIIHRIIKEYEKSKPSPERIAFLGALLKEAAKHSSETERTAVDAERASIKLTCAVMAKDYIGEEFNGTVSGLVSFGLFVMLDEIYAEGLIHLRDMLDDFYHYDEANYRLIGRRNKKVFQFGKRVRVRVLRSNVEKRSIDLSYVGEIIE
ncbi:MAG: ribonuclease [Bacteroidota bacterium]|nr:ribonuclease [Bacteroidota bacterium]